MKKYLKKFKATQSKPPRIQTYQMILSAIGACLAIGIIAYISSYAQQPLLIAPFGATSTLVFSPNLMISPVAQPRSVIGGYLVSGIVGILFAQFLGSEWYILALSVGVCVGLMHFLHVMHPPSAGVPLLILLNHSKTIDWSFLFYPLFFGTLIIISIAVIFNNLQNENQYPKYWF